MCAVEPCYDEVVLRPSGYSSAIVAVVAVVCSFASLIIGAIVGFCVSQYHCRYDEPPMPTQSGIPRKSHFFDDVGSVEEVSKSLENKNTPLPAPSSSRLPQAVQNWYGDEPRASLTSVAMPGGTGSGCHRSSSFRSFNKDFPPLPQPPSLSFHENNIPSPLAKTSPFTPAPCNVFVNNLAGSGAQEKFCSDLHAPPRQHRAVQL